MHRVRYLVPVVIAAAAGFALGYALTPSPKGGPRRQGPVHRPGGHERSAVERRPLFGAPPRFVEASREAGIDFRHVNGRTGRYLYLEIMGGGVALFDYDGDGDLDIYFVNGNRIDGGPVPEIANRLYRNDGGLRFRDVTAEAGVGDPSYGQGCCTGDYDGDGDEDLYVTNVGPNRLYRNEGGVFTEVSEEAGVADAGWGQSCAFFDYDGDGDLDLYVENYLAGESYKSEGSQLRVGGTVVRDYPSPLDFPGAPDRLYRNEGGRFQDVTREVGLHRPGRGMGIACADFDGDGRTDIFVANDTEENFFFLNRGGRFQEVGLLAGVAFSATGRAEASMGVDAGDIDGDGLLDLIVPCLQREFFTLYRNTGQGFADISVESGVARATAQHTGFNANFLDYDQDGDLDIFFTNGAVRRREGTAETDPYEEQYGEEDQLLAGDGRGHFEDVSALAGPYFSERRIGRGSAAGDLDGDGDVDLVVSNLDGRAALLRNETRGGNWILLDLYLEDGRRRAQGAKVELEAGGRRLYAELHARVGYLSQNDKRLHFGLGKAEKVDRLRIRWPGGGASEYKDLPAGRVWRIEKGEPPRAADNPRG